jgi:hypothetical protein
MPSLLPKILALQIRPLRLFRTFRIPSKKVLLPIPGPRIPSHQPAFPDFSLTTGVQNDDHCRHPLQTHAGQTSEGNSGHFEKVRRAQIHL